MSGTLIVVRDLLVDAVVLALPAALALAVVACLGIASRPLQAIYAMAAPCLVGYASGAVYLLVPDAGRPFTIAVYAGSVAALGWLVVARRPLVLPALRSWAAPAAILLAAAAFTLGLGFLYGGTGSPLATAATRYLAHLPGDNVLPQLFGSYLLAPQRPLPMLPGGWSTSDRPPLQTCVYLLIRSVLPGADTSDLQYQVTATLLQCLWLPALWCLLKAARAGWKATGLALTVTLLSGFTIVNAFYVWPKLFPAAFIVLLAAVLLTDELSSLRASSAAGVACGLAAALALLGHEGSSLALVPLVLVVAARRRLWPRASVIGLAAAVGVGLMIPWVLYQSFYDPPGTKLAKLQLAGQATVDPHQSLLGALASAYGRLTPAQIATNKLSNLEEPFLDEGPELRSLGQLASNLVAAGGEGARQRDVAIYRLRIASFYYLLPLLGGIALAPLTYLLLLLRRARGPDLEAAGRLWAWLLLNLATWALLLFGPYSTVIHQGTYATEMFALTAGVISLWRLLPRLTVLLVTAQSVVGLIVYATPPHQPSGLNPAGFSLGAALLAAAGLLCFFALVFGIRPGRAACPGNRASPLDHRHPGAPTE
jgi:hypothetical protein